MENKYKHIIDLEKVISDYTGSTYAITISSGADAIFLCLKWYLKYEKDISVSIPKHTSISVLSKIRECGIVPTFYKRAESPYLKGMYNLIGTPIIDSALSFYKDMYIKNTMICLSFSGSNKPLNFGRAGVILTDNSEAANWFVKARYFGSPFIGDRMDIEPEFRGWNFYLMPEFAERGLEELNRLDKDKIILKLKYPDISKFRVYL